MNKLKIIIIIIIAVLLASNVFFIVRELQFSIKYMVCDVGYANCFVSARFQDVANCQIEVERGSWYCDSTNPENIQCRVAKPNESFASAYCTK